jgi:hypothetical protein
MSTPVVRGRMITEAETAPAPFVIVVNESFARRYFPNQDLLGRQISLGGKDTGMLQPYTIVGVIGDQVEQSPASRQGLSSCCRISRFRPLRCFTRRS